MSESIKRRIHESDPTLHLWSDMAKRPDAAPWSLDQIVDMIDYPGWENKDDSVLAREIARAATRGMLEDLDSAGLAKFDVESDTVRLD